MTMSIEELFQELYDTESSVLASAPGEDLSDFKGRVKGLTEPTTLVAGLLTIGQADVPPASGKGKGKEQADSPAASGKSKGTAGRSAVNSRKGKGKQ
ncbi:hypothetical protein C0989_009038 [Termitomyces sp. Mn162]|nr:hypothetical protein C0989_009038 [Termitomyces sp. Mn162]